MRIVDVIPFFNELDLLELRLRTLEDHVDLFVVSEARTTFSGQPKPLYLSENLDRFSEWSDRLLVNVVDVPVKKSSFENDRNQKNAIGTRLDEICESDDLLVFGDADEIPDPQRFPEVVQNALSGQLVHFAQELSYYYLDLREVSGRLLSASGDFPGVSEPKWLGTRAFRWGTFDGIQLDDLRQPSALAGGKRIAQGGWHFSFVGSNGLSVDERVRTKLRAYAHQEFNNWRFMWGLKGRIQKGVDVLKRNAEFRICPISDLPLPVQERPDLYAAMLTPKRIAATVASSQL